MADWKDYNIQDEPTASTPLNTVTAEYLNGMANEIKEIKDIKNEIILKNSATQTTNVFIANIKGGILQISFSFKFTSQSTGQWFNPFEQLPLKYRPKNKVACSVSYDSSGDISKGAFAAFEGDGTFGGYIGSGISNNVNFTASWAV